MLFLSPHVNYQMLGIVPEQDVYHPANGSYLRTEPAVNAEFFHGGAPSWALEQALANPRFRSAWNGLPDGVDLRAYVGSFDTDRAAEDFGWDTKVVRHGRVVNDAPQEGDVPLKEYVEQFMLNHSDYGTRYAVAELPLELSGKPWPQYDECHHMQVDIVARNLGVNLADVLEYEKAHKNRGVVVRRLEEALVETPAEEDSLVVA